MENKNSAKLFCLLLPKFISDSYFVDKNVDKISQFRLGGNSQKSQQKPFPLSTEEWQCSYHFFSFINFLRKNDAVYVASTLYLVNRNNYFVVWMVLHVCEIVSQ